MKNTWIFPPKSPGNFRTSGNPENPEEFLKLNRVNLSGRLRVSPVMTIRVVPVCILLRKFNKYNPHKTHV
jgi:hypothetical protein